MRYLIRLVLVLTAFAACKDQGPPGPNFVARNEGDEPARFVVSDAASDTIFDRTLAIGERACALLHRGEVVTGVVVLSTDTLDMNSFWASEANNWADVLIVKAGPELIHTRAGRRC